MTVASATNPKTVPNLLLPVLDALECSEPDIVDLGIRAPDRAARDGDLELAREIDEVGMGR